ncbi:hypothetical protein GCM10010428_43530 [Actinosynnema pretiosum subsp. pretiosum]
MTSGDLRALRRLLGKLRADMELDDGTVYCGKEIQAIDDLAGLQLEGLSSTTS